MWTGWINGLRPTVWDLTRQSARSCTWVTTTPGLGRSGCKICPVEKDLAAPVDSWQNMNQQCAQLAKQANSFLDGIRNRVASRSRTEIIPLYSELVRLHLK